jgi:tetratricopeptide (TPR) repeat protein
LVGKEALEQARKWRYDPALKDGRPVVVRLEENVPVPTSTISQEGASRSEAAKHFQAGEALIRSGKYTEAVAAFDLAIASDPRLADAYYEKGLHWWQVQRLDLEAKLRFVMMP